MIKKSNSYRTYEIVGEGIDYDVNFLIVQSRSIDEDDSFLIYLPIPFSYDEAWYKDYKEINLEAEIKIDKNVEKKI